MDNRAVGIIEISLDLLHKMFRLPNDVKFERVVDIPTNYLEHSTVKILISSPRLPQVKKNEIIPTVYLNCKFYHGIESSDINI